MAPVMLVHLLIAAWGWSWGLAVATGLLASILLGAIVEMAVIRRFRKAPRLLLTVATIGLAQVLGGIAIALPALFDEMVLAPQLDPPFNLDFTFGGGKRPEEHTYGIHELMNITYAVFCMTK